MKSVTFGQRIMNEPTIDHRESGWIHAETEFSLSKCTSFQVISKPAWYSVNTYRTSDLMHPWPEATCVMRAEARVSRVSA